MQPSPAGLSSALPAGPMLHALAENWWMFLVKGICAVVFGVLTFVWPGLTLVTLVLLYGVFALTDGVFAIAAAIKGGAPAPRWWLAVVGAIGIGAGLFTLMQPGLTGLVLLMFIAAWAIVTGAMEIVGAIRLRKEIDDEWFLITSGVLSVLFGFLLIVRPGMGALSLALAIGAFAIFFGALQVSFAMRLRSYLHPAT